MTSLNRLIARRDDMRAALRVIDRQIAEEVSRQQVSVGRYGVGLTQKKAGDLVMTSRGFVQVEA